MNKLKFYFIGISWFITSLLVSAINDVISKYVSISLHSLEIAFFRFLFSTLTLLPFIAYYNIKTIKTHNYLIHVIRSVLLFFATITWIYGLRITPVSTATVISFTIPLFVLVLAALFLKEKVLWQRWIVILLGFVSIIIIIKPHIQKNNNIIIFLLSAIAFAMLDIINKKFILKESTLCMLFYSSLLSTIFCIPFTILYWIVPSLSELILLLILGINTNLILFCLLKSFALADITAIAPFRYLELLFSSLVAYFVFDEIIENNTLYGAIILIPSMLFIIYSERKYYIKTN